MATRDYVVTCLSPLHIGSGKQFTKLDGLYSGEKWWLVDLDKTLRAGLKADDLAFQMNDRGFSWSRYLSTRRIDPPKVAAYGVPCPRDPGEVPVREAIKNAYLQPYIPGASIKGAIRTAVLWRLINEDTSHQASLKLYLEQVGKAPGRKREWVAQTIERGVLGPDPNHDLMRSIQVSDSKALGSESLSVGHVWTYTLQKNRLVEKKDSSGEYSIFAEWLKAESRTTTAVRTDEYLFSDGANERLAFRGAGEQAIRDLAHTCNEHYRGVIKSEKEFYAAHELDALEDFYSDLETILNSLPAGAFLLNTGWGGGWEFKTLGNLLKDTLGKPGFDALRQRFRLGENPRTRELHLDAPFPHTRHIAYDGGAPAWALGWIVLDPVSGRLH
jgi:CRISPR-associated protein Csm5